MRKQKRLIKLVAVTLMIALMVPMAAFASVQELTFDTTKKGVSLAGKYPAYDDIALQYSMTEDASHKITIPTKLEALGIAKGTTVQTKNFGKDFMSGMKTLVGGELHAYTEMLNEARQIATKRMVDEAESLGADAVINIRYGSASMMQGAAEVIVYGTAVKFK